MAWGNWGSPAIDPLPYTKPCSFDQFAIYAPCSHVGIKQDDESVDVCVHVFSLVAKSPYRTD